MKLHCVFKIVFIFSKVLFLAPQSEAARSSNPARGAFTVEGEGRASVTLPRGLYFVRLNGLTKKVMME